MAGDAAGDIAAWLGGLGLERYVQTFRDHEIDTEVLSDLTDGDLEKLGIPLGHRKKLLRAIAGLTAAEPDRRAAPGAISSAPRASEAERRQLTVLFCDLVGSTELAARLDPEDLREVMRAYQAACVDVVGRFEGHVARFLGDGVLAYFGWPRAHEDAAERAVRAGLQLVQDVARLEPRAEIRLQARVGVATGHVVVGDLISGGVSDRDAVSGETPNLAARLQAVAAPGRVVISPSTRRLVAGLFELGDLGPQRLKGFAEPLSAWQVEGQGRAEGRFESRQTTSLTPLVGREEEIALLLSRWRRAQGGEGQVVVLAGEPGIGKSRLAREVHNRLAGEPHIRLLYHCSPHHTTSPFHPVIEHLERAAGFERDDPPEARLGKLVALLARGTDKLDHAVPLIAALLGIPTGERYPTLELTPQRQKELTLEALLEQLAGLAAAQPVLVVHEDVHWIDPTTQELLNLAIERTQRLSVLMIITLRPEFTPPWVVQPHVITLALSRLGRRDRAAMVDRVVGAKALPDEVAEQILAKTDGVPLFVEELTKAVLESGLLADAGDHYELSGPLPPLAIPETLHDSLLARLDRLARVKEVAQIGAAIGREFSHALLAAVADRPEPELQAALDQLVSSELVFRHGTPPDVTYSFKHALVQDAAYGTLLKSRRQQLHARIAKVLEQQFPPQAETQPELVARHYTAAGLAAEAVPYWLRAGRHALRRSAVKEAIAQLTQGLDQLGDLSTGPDRDRKEIDLRLALGHALGDAKSGAALETGQEYARAAELCERTGDMTNLIAALYGLTTFHFSRGELTLAREVAERSLAAAGRSNDTLAEAGGHFSFGWVNLALGCLNSAWAPLQHAIEMLGPATRQRAIDTYSVDLRVVSLVYLSWTLIALGYLDRGRDLSRQALAEAEGLGHPATLAVALDRTTAVAEFCRDVTTVSLRAETMSALGREQGFPYYVAKGDLYRGWVMVTNGLVTEGTALMRAALSALRVTGDEEFMPHSLGLLAEAQAKLQETLQALSLVRDALARATRTDERLFEADLHRLAGDLLVAL
ncbi:MAG TPA: AAA family ATPase, partial [Geminicoccaceae bacterium]